MSVKEIVPGFWECVSTDTKPQGVVYGRLYETDTNKQFYTATPGTWTEMTIPSHGNASHTVGVAPADVTKAAAAEGTNTAVARADHKHDISTAAAGASAFADTAAEGTATSLARSDHRHSREANPITAHEAAADPHTGYRLESADHSHQSTGLQGGTLDHGLALTGVTANQHHNQNHTDAQHTDFPRLANVFIFGGY